MSFSTFYHSLIFTLLTLYDEEWDVLMFQEYRGSGVSIIIWQSMSMVIGYIIFSGFLTCSLSRELEIIMDGSHQEPAPKSQMEIVRG